MGKVIWLTGKSGAGKTTIAKRLQEDIDCVFLDGDEMRKSISTKAGFSREDRKEHNLRVARLAKELAKQKNVVVPVIAPMKDVRKEIDGICSPVWVYVKRELPEREGHFYEEPEDYFTVDHDALSVEESVSAIKKHLKKCGIYDIWITDHLRNLKKMSIFLIRETKVKFKNPIVLWSTGKDSTAMLGLIKEAFHGEIPFPVVHIDTSFKPKEVYEFRDNLAKEWGFDLQIIQNKKAVEAGVSPNTHKKVDCCTQMKTEALKEYVNKNNVDAIIVSIRRDEHGVRNIERYVSPRDKDFKWNIATEKETPSGDSPFVSEQELELAGWNLFQTDFGENCSHVRVHPILHWNEIDCWYYMRDIGLPINPLYYAKDGKRFRSLGCVPCTTSMDSTASNIDEIIEELEHITTAERDGRAQDSESPYAFEFLRQMGYM